MRKLLYFFGCCFVFFLLVLAALPLWMPWVVKPAADGFGLSYDSYERIGYARFALEGIRFEEDNIVFTGDRAEGRQPLAWAWAALLGKDDGRPFLALDGWRLEIEPPEPPEPPEVPEPPDVSVYEIFGIVDEILPHAIRWAPRLEANGGTVVLPDFEIAVQRVLWDRGLVEAEGGTEIEQQWFGVVLRGDARTPSRIEAEADLVPFGATVALAAERRAEALHIEGDGIWQSNRLVFSGRFGREGLLPAVARLDSESVRIPAELLGMEGFDAVEGDLAARWEDEAFRVDVKAGARPLDESPYHFPVDVELSAGGDLKKVAIEAATIDTPWLRVELSERLEIDYTGRLLSEESQLTASADLSRLPFVEASGSVNTRVFIYPGESRFPDLVFAAGGEELEAFDIILKSFEADGRVVWAEGSDEVFSWPDVTVSFSAEELAGFDLLVRDIRAAGNLAYPRLNLETLEANLADGTSLSGYSDFDMERRYIEAGEVALDLREDDVRDYLPEGVGFGAARFGVRFSGPIDRISHEAEFALDRLTLPQLRPGDLAVSWRGDFLDLEDWRVQWQTEDEATIEAVGAFRGARDRALLDLSQLRFFKGDEEFLALEAPAQVEVNESEADMEEAAPWRIAIDALVLEGPDRTAMFQGEIDWPARGHITAAIENFNPSFLRHYATATIPDLDVDRLAFDSSWDEGPLTFSLENRMRFEIEDEGVFETDLDLEGDGDGLRISRFAMRDSEGDILFAEGDLPVIFFPARLRDPVELNPEKELVFAARSNPDAAIWTRLDDLLGVTLDAPQLNVDLAGTLANPVGRIGLRVARIGYQGAPDDMALPVVEDVDFLSVFDLGEARIERLRLFVEGQEVNAEASWPLGDDAWLALVREGEAPDWRNIEGRLFIDRAQLRAFARFFPAILAPEGTLSVNLAVRGDRFLEGSEIVLEGASTRPIMPLGSIQNMQARILFEDRTAVLEEFSGRLGGERVVIDGVVSFPAYPEALEPTFNFNIAGMNVPLARDSGLVIRGDLDLNIRGSAEETPRISGAIDMRDSLVVAELQEMAPGAVATPERRPPFFSVDIEPFSEWILDVVIRGDQFLSVRAPVFRGRLSANFNLRGTLLEPQAIGEARIDTGQIRFPFAAMRITQGIVSLTEDDPYRPRLFITAASRTFGYDLRMDLSGTADNPSLEFSSHPPLSSEAVLLMITAGELPRQELQFTRGQKATKLAFYIAQNLFLEFGDDGAEERLTIRAAENISEQGRETFYIEYMFHPRWGVVGEYDRFDAFNAGLKWKFYSR